MSQNGLLGRTRAHQRRSISQGENSRTGFSVSGSASASRIVAIAAAYMGYETASGSPYGLAPFGVGLGRRQVGVRPLRELADQKWLGLGR